MASLASFPLLDTIEILVHFTHRQDIPLSELAASDVKEASKILKENKSQAEKTVVLTKWNDVWDHAKSVFDADKGYMTREAIRV